MLTCTGLPPAAGLPPTHLLQLGRALPCEQAAVLACRVFFLILYFFSIYQKYMSCFFIFKNVTQPPVHPAEGCYRRMNRR